MYRKILYPTDFDEFSYDLLQCVLQLKAVGLREVVLLHVVDERRLQHNLLEGYRDQEAEQLRELAKLRFAEWEEPIRTEGLEVRVRIETGLPYQQILRVAAEERVSLIIGGSQRRHRRDEGYLDPTTHRLIGRAPCPILVAKYHFLEGEDDKDLCERVCTNLFDRIVYPTDWSDCAHEALSYVKGLKETGVCEVAVVHVMEERVMKMIPAEKYEEFRTNDTHRLDEVKKSLQMAGFQVDTHLHVGIPAAEIIKAAHEVDATLIVMAAHGKGFLEEMLSGSVSRKVTERSPTSVLLVQPCCVARAS